MQILNTYSPFRTNPITADLAFSLRTSPNGPEATEILINHSPQLIRMKKLLTITLCLALAGLKAQQNVGIGTNTPAASALLHINSTSKGLLIPRLTSAQRSAISSPANGLQVYDTNTNSFWFYKANAWVELGAGGGGSNAWAASNNNISNTNAGNVGIGTNVPFYKLEVNGNGAFAGSAVTYGFNGQSTLFGGGVLKLSSAASASVTNSVLIDGNQVQAYYMDAGQQDEFSNTLLLNALGGNLGIGTSSPVANSRVTIQTIADFNTALTLKNPSGTARFDAYIGGPANGNSISMGTPGAMPIAFYINGVNRLFLNDNGYVGIGVNSPSFSKLEIRIGNEERGWAVGTPFYNMHTFLGGAGRSANSEGCYLGTSGVVTGGAAVPLHFFTNAQWAQMTLLPNGNVGIGTTDPTYKLSVRGNIRSNEVVVETGWADYVFNEGYNLTPLEEVEQYILQHKHLPNIPSAAEIEQKGLSVGDTQKRMMEKIEELTLYIIQLKKEMAAIKSSIN